MPPPITSLPSEDPHARNQFCPLPLFLSLLQDVTGLGIGDSLNGLVVVKIVDLRLERRNPQWERLPNFVEANRPGLKKDLFPLICSLDSLNGHSLARSQTNPELPPPPIISLPSEDPHARNQFCPLLLFLSLLQDVTGLGIGDSLNGLVVVKIINLRLERRDV